MRLSLHPIFNLQPWNAVEMFKVVCNNGQSFMDALTCNNHVKLIYKLSVFAQRVFYLCITISIVREMYNGKFLEQFAYQLHFFFKVRFLFGLCIISTIIKFMERDYGHATILNTNFQKTFNNARCFRTNLYQYICVKQILLILLHTCNLSFANQKCGFHVSSFFSLLLTFHRYNEVHEVHAAIPHHSCAAWHAPILQAQPDARLTTDGYLGLDRLTYGEYSLMTMSYS